MNQCACNSLWCMSTRLCRSKIMRYTQQGPTCRHRLLIYSYNDLISHFCNDKMFTTRFVKNVSPFIKPKWEGRIKENEFVKCISLLQARPHRVYRLQSCFLPEEKINTLHQPNAAKSWLRFVSLSLPPATLAGLSFGSWSMKLWKISYFFSSIRHEIVCVKM